jgi:hypothetical protein
MNVALAADMPDAPVTQDTVTTGKDGDENDDKEGDEDNDQRDNLPDPKDAPGTTETITSGENEGSNEDKSNWNPAPIPSLEDLEDCPSPIKADADIEVGIDYCGVPAGDQPVIDNDKANRQSGEIENNMDISPTQACPKNQERALFVLTCMPTVPIPSLDDPDDLEDRPNLSEANADIDVDIDY